MNNIFSKATRYIMKMAGSLFSVQSSFSAGGIIYDNPTDIKSMESYYDSLYLYIGVNMIAFDVSSVDIVLKEVKNLNGDTDEIFQDELLDIINKPNKLQSRREFWQVSVMHYLLSGETIWYKEKEGNKIIGLWTLRPDKTSIILSNDGKEVLGYEFHSDNGEIMKFTIEDIIHIKNPSPLDYLRGVGVVTPARTRILSEKEASAYQANFFLNQGRPDVAVFSDKSLTTDQITEARKTWNQIYGGAQGSRVGFFGENVTRIEHLSTSPKEMDFIQSLDKIRDDILASLHIPKSMVTSDNVNLANAKVGKQIYQEGAVLPIVKIFLEGINNRLIPVESKKMFDYIDFIEQDRELLRKEAKELKEAGIINLNEARDLVGYEAVENGDDFQVSQQIQTFNLMKSRARAKTHIRNNKMLARILKLEDQLVTIYSTERGMTPLFNSEVEVKNFLNTVEKKVGEDAMNIELSVYKFFDEQRDRILELNPELFDVLSFMDIAEENNIARSHFESLFKKIYLSNASKVLSGLDGQDFFVAPELILALNERVNFFTDSMNTTTHKQLSEVIAKALSEGKSQDAIARDIRAKFSDMKLSRAKTIARTESNNLFSKGSYDAYMQSGVVTGMQWLSATDERVRDEHKENHGKIVPKGSLFPSGETRPSEHSINCRCRLAPVVG